MTREYGKAMSEQELREKIKQIRSENQSLASLLETSAIDELQALITQYANEARIESQTNAVAWCVGVLDEFHNMPHEYSSQRDKFYKGAKNGIRDRYRSETGVDPAPDYPIKAKLEQESKS